MDPVRQKALRRFQKFHALGKSPNANEARRALEQAERLAARYGFTKEDEQEPLPVVRRVGGPAGPEDAWRETVAYGVAMRWDCKPLRGDGKIVFEGVKAVEAVAEYRTIVQGIEEAQHRRWRAYDHKYRMTMREMHREQFVIAAAEMTAQFAGTLGEDQHSLRISFADEGRLEAREIMRNQVLKKDTR